MSKAHIAAKEPQEVSVKAGKNYAWCACGLSSNQPLCDGTHQKGDLRPLLFKPEKDAEVWLCQCKQTKNPPFCDGTHNAI